MGFTALLKSAAVCGARITGRVLREAVPLTLQRAIAGLIDRLARLLPFVSEREKLRHKEDLRPRGRPWGGALSTFRSGPLERAISGSGGKLL